VFLLANSRQLFFFQGCFGVGECLRRPWDIRAAIKTVIQHTDEARDGPHLWCIVAVYQLDGLAVQKAPAHGELCILPNIAAFSWDGRRGRSNENLKDAILGLSESVVLREKALVLRPCCNSPNLVLRDFRGVGIIGGQMTFVNKAEMQKPLLVGREDGAIGSLRWISASILHFVIPLYVQGATVSSS